MKFLLIQLTVVTVIGNKEQDHDANSITNPSVYAGFRLAKGNKLFYRENPKVNKIRSAIHELYMRPYNHDNIVHHAIAVLKSDAISGIVHFYQTGGPTSPVSVIGNVTGLSTGYHGFHVHQYGDMSDGCKSMKGHFNPHKVPHGSVKDGYRHVGDLGNILAGENGIAGITIMNKYISLNGMNSIIGRGVVIHDGKDDLGKDGDKDSLATGNAGTRLVCATISLAEDVKDQ